MKRLSRNVLSIAGSDIARRVLGFFTVAYLARKLGTASFGAINIAFTVFSYALMVSSAGLNSFGTRAIARGEPVGIVNSIIRIRFINGLVAYLLVAGIAFFLIPNAVTGKLILIFCTALFAHAFLVEWYFQGKEAMGVIGIGRLLSAAIYLVLILVCVRTKEDILWVGIASVAGDIAAAVMLMSVFRTQHHDERLRMVTGKWNSLMRESFPLGLGSTIASLSTNLTPILIGIILTNVEAGVYSAAGKLIVFLLMFDRVLGTLLLPASSRLHAQSPEAFSATLGVALRWILLIALPIVIGGTVLADRIIPLIFGSQYMQAIPVFRILLWFFLITMLHTIYSSGLIAIGEEKAYGKVMLISGAIYAILLVGATLFFGLIGASAAMVIAESITVVLMRQHFHRHRVLPLPRSIPMTILAAAVMGAAVLLLSSLHVLLAIILGAVIYFSILFVTRTLTMDDVSSLLERV